MKKPNKLKKPKLKKPARPFKGVKLRRTKTPEQKVSDALSNVPRITNETVGEHREEVLSSARKYIYPLQHSKHRIVRISLGLLIFVILAFFTFCGLALYKFQMTSGFMYDVTRIIPFPVAKIGNHWVSYESYLFELRRNMHYYQTQQGSDFSTKEGKEQLVRLKQQALEQVVQDAYVKQLADQNGVSVSNQQVDNQLDLVKTENRLGNSDRVFREVLNEFWGWNEADFKRELKQQMLAQAVVAKLDKQTNAQAQAALKQLKGGTDFAALAAQVSEDPVTKASGGQYPLPVTLSSKEVPPTVTAELFRLKPGQTSGVVNAGYSLEILKAGERKGNGVEAAHIQFNFDDVSQYTKSLRQKEPPRAYIKI